MATFIELPIPDGFQKHQSNLLYLPIAAISAARSTIEFDCPHSHEHAHKRGTFHGSIMEARHALELVHTRVLSHLHAPSLDVFTPHWQGIRHSTGRTPVPIVPRRRGRLTCDK